MKDQKPFLSMQEFEEAIKKRMQEINNPTPVKRPLKIKLWKQQIFTEIISLWEIEGQFLEVTQTSQGKYLIYKLRKKELEEWNNYSHFSGGLSDESANVGVESRILTGEWGGILKRNKQNLFYLDFPGRENSGCFFYLLRRVNID